MKANKLTMKANELMLDDWVHHNGKPKKVNVVWYNNQVSLDDPEQAWGSIYTDKFPADEIEPIPITAEILDKNFTYDVELENFKWPTYKGEYFVMSIDDDGVMIGQRGIGFYGEGYIEYFMTIKYVHELQHLLKLFNSIKEIKL